MVPLCVVLVGGPCLCSGRALLPGAPAAENVVLPLRFSGELCRDPAAARRKVLELLEQIGGADRANGGGRISRRHRAPAALETNQ
jgi:hypothetical protein